MGAVLSKPKTPSIPVAPPAASPATAANSQVQSAGDNARARAAAGAAASLENPTGPQGLTEKPATTGATLLG